MDAATIQAAAAVASLVASAGIGAAAIVVAWRANDIASKAARIAESARDISHDALEQSKRQVILNAVPFLAVEQPIGVSADRWRVPVVNGSATVAYGVLVSIAPAAERNLDSVDESRRQSSGRQPAWVPGQNGPSVNVTTGPISTPWMHVRLEYVSPLGAHVTHDYIGPTHRQDQRFRLHLVTIDLQDGSDPVRFPIDLGRFDDEPDIRPTARIY